MAPQCPICLNNLKNPVCPPCGHAFCAECLSRAVGQVNNGTQAPCSYCRKVFPIVMPDGQSLPPQLRPFVMDPIRRVYITTDDSQDQQNTRQHIESLERENQNLEERIEELEAESEELLAPILLPSFPGPDLDPVRSSVASDLSNSMNIQGDSAHPRSPPSFAPEPQFIHPQYIIDTGPARSLAPVSAIGPNVPSSSHTVVEILTITRQETWVTTSARPGGVPMSSTMSNAASTSVFTNPFARLESQHSIPYTPAHHRGAGQASMAHPSFVNTGGVSFSGPITAGQWTVTVPSNRPLNVPNQPTPLAAPHFINGAGTRQYSLRRESQPRTATPASAGQGPSAMGFTMVDVPESSSSSETGSRRSSQSS